MNKNKLHLYKKVWEIISKCLMFLLIWYMFFHLPVEGDITKVSCKSYNTDGFKKCIDIGFERCGFFCSNHYYLCDNIKIVRKCLEREEEIIVKNKTIVEYIFGGSKEYD